MARETMDWVVITLLVLSIAVSGVMLATDETLWEFSPSHAYAVVAFIVVFAILIGLIFWRPSMGLLVTMIWSVLLIAAMILDPLTASTTDFITGEPVFGGFTEQEALVYLWTEQPLFTFPILFVLVVLTLILAFVARRKQ